MKQGQQFNGPTPDILMRVAGRFTDRLPTGAGLRNRLIRPGFIRAPDRQSPLASLPVSLLDQFFLASVSGSVTVTTTV